MAGSGRRFALEAVFLVGLAVALGLAGLSTGWIIGIMALGWFLTALVELVSWRFASRHPSGVPMDVALPAAPEGSVPLEAPPVEPNQGAAGAGQEPGEELRPDDAEADVVSEVSEPADTKGSRPADEGTRPAGEAKPAAERRRGLFRRRTVPTGESGAADVASQPRHVRLIPKPSEEPADPDAVVDEAVRPATGAEGA